MTQFGELLGLSLGLQESQEAKTILQFLRERMDGADRMERRKSLAQRLGLKGIGCCGATWGIRPSHISIMDDDEHSDGDDSGPPRLQPQNHTAAAQQSQVVQSGQVPVETNSDPVCDSGGQSFSGMNLADALAAERQFRVVDDSEDGLGLTQSPNRLENEPETPLRVSLMRLLEETDDGENVEEKGVVGSTGNDSVCCVCMGRKKGSAFIPCGHTFCRICSRELWLNRGTCPLCNRQIIEILDIF